MRDGPPHPFVTSLIGQKIAGRYIVERVLRAGGMGVVALGRYPELEQEVAIKFMKPEYAAYDVLCARFLREARLAARVKSPHFVRVFDFGRIEPNVPYLVMEMLTGRDLADEIDEGGAMPVALAVDYVLQACVALAEVHGMGIVHRDLKPSNLFLASVGRSRMLKVLDFGVSKESVGEALTSTGAPIGTPHYMSPEQVKEAKNVDARTDIWALGVILYELVTACVPFGQEGQPIGEVYGMIMHVEPTPPRQYMPSLPLELEAVILKCLRRDPALRYPDVGALADALWPFANAESAARVRHVHEVSASSVRPPPFTPVDSDRSAAPAASGPFASERLLPSGGAASKAASTPFRKPLRSGGAIEGPHVADEESLGPTRAIGPPARVRPETSLTATRSPDASAPDRAPTPKRGALIFIGALAFVVGAGIAASAFWHGKNDDESTQSPSPSSAASAPVATSTAIAPPIPSPPTPAATTPVFASPTVSASARPVPSQAPSARHHTPPPVSTAKAQPNEPNTGSADLLNDRK
ncbi:MAG: protein kinase domain-containing protein [Polyangiaceae bacterium]|jgi:eukaryotic-like serine/threonine-protein kinase